MTGKFQDQQRKRRTIGVKPSIANLKAMSPLIHVRTLPPTQKRSGPNEKISSGPRENHQ
jgi:hypothetical protein